MLLRSAALPALLLAFTVSACAQVPPAEEPREEADLPMAGLPMAPMGPPPGVRKITDGALGCEQIYAESQALEASVARHRSESEAAQKEANAAQESMMKSASGGAGMSMGSSLLGMIPGAGMFSGMAQQAAMSAQMSGMQESQSKMMAAYQRMMQAQEQLAYAQGRNDHLVGLFLEKKCKVPEGQAKP